MYSLLMVSGQSYWQERNGCNFDMSRYLEWTVPALQERLRPITAEVVEELKKWPVLFAYELPWRDEASGDPARVGWLTDIQLRAPHIRIGYRFDEEVPPVSATQLRRILWELDIGDSEISRTHWAVKDVDLLQVLRNSGALGGLPGPVPAPDLKTISQTVELALEDAERMLRDGRASNALDRVHTVLHGYLVNVCADAGLVAAGELPTMTAAFKKLREEHPSFAYAGPREGEIGLALRASAQFIESFNTLRNNASVAHPYNTVVPEPEAMYLINMARSLLHYIEMKLQK
jgi:hypothetical protein